MGSWLFGSILRKYQGKQLKKIILTRFQGVHSMVAWHQLLNKYIIMGGNFREQLLYFHSWKEMWSENGGQGPHSRWRNFFDKTDFLSSRFYQMPKILSNGGSAFNKWACVAHLLSKQCAHTALQRHVASDNLDNI